MEFNLMNIIAILSVVIAFLGLSRIDNLLKGAQVEEKIRGQVNSVMLLVVIIVALLSGYILFV